MNDQTWLASVRPGDKIVLMVDNEARLIDKAARVTMSKITVEGHGEFSKKHGKSRDSEHIWIAEPTAARIAEVNLRIERGHLLNCICSQFWSDLDTETLRKVAEVIKGADSHTQAPR